MSIRERQHNRLNRCQPNRELTRIVFDQDADKTLKRTHQGTVDHYRTMFSIIRTCVCDVKTLRHAVVELDRAELPRSPNRICHVKIDLRTVESTIAWVELKLKPLRSQRTLQRCLSVIPHLIGSDPLLRPSRQLE